MSSALNVSPVFSRFHNAVNRSLKHCRVNQSPIRVSRLVSEVKTAVGPCRLTDMEIEAMVCDYAILRGINLHFDGLKS